MNQMTRSWYTYVGKDNPLDEKNYLKVGGKPGCLCGNNICAIYVRGHERQLEIPLSTNIQKYIKDALATEFVQPDSPFDTKIFVYLRDF